MARGRITLSCISTAGMPEYVRVCSKMPLPLNGSETPSHTWFYWRTRVHLPNGTSIGSAVFAGLINVSDRQTETQTDEHDTLSAVAIVRI